MRSRFWLLILVGLVGSCLPEQEVVTGIDQRAAANAPLFTVDDHQILKEGKPFPVRGVGYVPAYPGDLPWVLEGMTTLPEYLPHRIDTDVANIADMGANTVRLWGAPRYCYKALYNNGKLNFIQTIWIQGDVPDFQDVAFKQQTKSYIKQVNDRIYRYMKVSHPW